MRNVKRASQLLAQASYTGTMSRLLTRNSYPSFGPSGLGGSFALGDWVDSSSHSRMMRGFATKKASKPEEAAVPKERKKRSSSKSASGSMAQAQSEETSAPAQDINPNQPDDFKKSQEPTNMEAMKELILRQTFQTEPGLATIASLGKADPRGKGGKNEVKLLRNVIDAVLTLNKHRIAKQETGLSSYLNFNTMSLPLSLAEQSDAAEMLNTLLRDTYLRYELLKGKSIRNSVRRRASNHQCCSAMVSASKMRPKSTSKPRRRLPLELLKESASGRISVNSSC